MSVLAHQKRGQSLYIEHWNSSAKRFVVCCALCGKRGFKPSVLDDGFAISLEKKVIRCALEAHLEPLALDEFDRCDFCAEHQDTLISRSDKS